MLSLLLLAFVVAVAVVGAELVRSTCRRALGSPVRSVEILREPEPTGLRAE